MTHDTTSTPLQYVILRHEGVATPHFDLMFESSPGSALTTWRSDRWPIDRPTVLTKLAEHRREYLDYEGPVSGDRGFVRRVAKGSCRIAQQSAGKFWSIEMDVGLLHVKHARDDEWLAVPACGQ